jgi:hypothetical protein
LKIKSKHKFQKTMYKMKQLFFTILFSLFYLAIVAQSARESGYSSITHESIQGQLEFLASDWMEGRATGSRGIFMASDYLASMFKVFGIQPFGDQETIRPTREEMRQGKQPETRKTYFQNIALLRYEPGEIQQFSVISRKGQGESAIEFGHRIDFQVQTGTVSISGKSPVFFAGYGMSEKDYDEFARKDVKGKAVLIISGFPGHRDSVSAAYKKFRPSSPSTARFSPEREKIRKAEEQGAAAIILYNPDANPALGWANNNPYPVKGAYYEADQRLSSFYDKRITLPGDTLSGNIPVFTVTARVANMLLDGTGVNLQSYEQLAQQTMQPASRDLQGKEVSWHSTVNSEIIKCRNVMGYIEGKNKDEFVVVGAHYDHIGKYDGWIWNGADDNGSGTVGMMTLARAFAVSGEKPEKSIIFAAWTGEEMGLHGSRYFVDNFPKDKKITYNLNFDMLSRNADDDTKGNRMSMMYLSSTPKLRELTEKNLREFNIDLDVAFRPSAVLSGGSDHAPFARVGIPATFFFAAMHPDYHLPSDELSKINWTKMLNMIRLGYLNVWDIANSDIYLERAQ